MSKIELFTPNWRSTSERKRIKAVSKLDVVKQIKILESILANDPSISVRKKVLDIVSSSLKDWIVLDAAVNNSSEEIRTLAFEGLHFHSRFELLRQLSPIENYNRLIEFYFVETEIDNLKEIAEKLGENGCKTILINEGSQDLKNESIQILLAQITSTTELKEIINGTQSHSILKQAIQKWPAEWWVGHEGQDEIGPMNDAQVKEHLFSLDDIDKTTIRKGPFKKYPLLESKELFPFLIQSIEIISRKNSWGISVSGDSWTEPISLLELTERLKELNIESSAEIRNSKSNPVKLKEACEKYPELSETIDSLPYSEATIEKCKEKIVKTKSEKVFFDCLEKIKGDDSFITSLAIKIDKDSNLHFREKENKVINCIWSIKDQHLILKIAVNSNSRDIQDSARMQLESEEIIAELLLHENFIGNPAGAGKICDQILLKRIIASDKKIAHHAIENVVDINSFIDIGLNSKNSYLRSKFIERITDENYLKLFVLKDNSLNNRSEAIKKINNISFLKEIAFNAKDLKTRNVVLEKIGEPNFEKQFVVIDKEAESKAKQLEKQKLSQEELIRIATTENHWNIRKVAVKYINSDDVKFGIAFSDPDTNIRILAVKEIKNSELVKRLVLESDDSEVTCISIQLVKDEDFLNDIRTRPIYGTWLCELAEEQLSCIRKAKETGESITSVIEKGEIEKEKREIEKEKQHIKDTEYINDRINELKKLTHAESKVKFLKELITEALVWGKSNSYPLPEKYPHYKLVRMIGEEIAEKGGLVEMQKIAYSFRDENFNLADMLSSLWDGCGPWRR